jgi:hypothetical protein
MWWACRKSRRSCEPAARVRISSLQADFLNRLIQALALVVCRIHGGNLNFQFSLLGGDRLGDRDVML